MAETTEVVFEGKQETTFDKFSRQEWNKVEKQYDSDIMRLVLRAMSDLGTGSQSDNEKEGALKCCGEEVYMMIRPKMEEIGLVPPQKGSISKKKDDKKEGKKKKPKPGSKQAQQGPKKIDRMIESNVHDRINKEIDSVLETFTTDHFNPKNGFNRPFTEIRLVTLMYCVNYFMKKKTSTQAQKYELVAGISRTLKNIGQIQGISATALNDLNWNFEKLASDCGFNFSDMFDKFPRLCLSTKYDSVFPTLALKPYTSQNALMEVVRDTEKTGGLYIYKAMIGSGKTTWIVAWCASLIRTRMSQKASGKVPAQVIFSCSIEPVRREVCRMAYNQKIPFGVAVVDRGEVRVINNYNCQRDDDRILIVADLDSTYGLLKVHQNYVLFLDEPTVGADQEDHPITRAVCKIMTVAPKQTVLSSATMPESSEIPEIISEFLQRYPGSKVHEVVSKEALIGCTVIDLKGTTLLPHNGCQTVAELSAVLNHLRNKPFVDRLYTAPIVYKLTARMEEVGVPDLIDLEGYFKKLGVINQTEIQRVAISLLEKLLKTDDKTVKAVCEPMNALELGDVPEQERQKEEDSEEDDDLFAWEEDEKEEPAELPPGYDLNKIFTQDAHKFAGPCLVTTPDPVKFAFEKSRELLANTETAANLIKAYEEHLRLIEVGVTKFDNLKVSEDEKSQKIQEFRETNRATINFPSHLKVNSPRHLMKYAPHMKGQIDPALLQMEYPLEILPMDMNIYDWLMLLLFAGVGVYCPSSEYLNARYHETVLGLMADGKLAFLISDGSISYGANYPFSHVLITDEIAELHSINTLFQLAGRAGRVGTSWVAYIHVGPNTATRIMNYIRQTDKETISEEATNMNLVYQKILDEDAQRKEKKRLAKIEQEARVKQMEEERKKEELRKEAERQIELEKQRKNEVKETRSHQHGERRQRDNGDRSDRGDRGYSDRRRDTDRGDRGDRGHGYHGDRRDNSQGNRGDRNDRPYSDRNHGYRDDRGDYSQGDRGDRNNGYRGDRGDRNQGDRNSRREYEDPDSSAWRSNKPRADQPDSNQKSKPTTYVPPHLRQK